MVLHFSKPVSQHVLACFPFFFFLHFSGCVKGLTHQQNMQLTCSGLFSFFFFLSSFSCCVKGLTCQQNMQPTCSGLFSFFFFLSSFFFLWGGSYTSATHAANFFWLVFLLFFSFFLFLFVGWVLHFSKPCSQLFLACFPSFFFLSSVFFLWGGSYTSASHTANLFWLVFLLFFLFSFVFFFLSFFLSYGFLFFFFSTFFFQLACWLLFLFVSLILSFILSSLHCLEFFHSVMVGADCFKNHLLLNNEFDLY